MQLMDTVDHMIEMVEIRLTNGLPVPIDTIAHLVENGIDYNFLETRILSRLENNANGVTTNG